MPRKKSTLIPWYSDPAFSPEALKKRIEKFAPQTAQYREQRQNLYLELEKIGRPKDTPTYGPNVIQYVLLQIVAGYHLLVKDLKKAREREAKYKRERERIEWQLDKIISHDIVRQAPCIGSFVFYQSHEVYCLHDRPRKRCTICGELELLEQMRGSKQKRRIRKLEAEIVDPLSRAEIKGGLPPPSMTSAGAPEKHLQNFLLGTVAACLYNAGKAQNEVCSLVSKILVFCFPICRPETGGKLEDYVATHVKALLEQWRVLMAKPGYAAPSAKRRQLSDKDVLPRPR